MVMRADTELPFVPEIHCTNGETLVPPAEMVEPLNGGALADGCAPFPELAPAPVRNGGVKNESHEYCKENCCAAEDLLSVARHWETRIEGFLRKKWAEGNVLMDVQEQARISLGVVEEALRKWR